MFFQNVQKFIKAALVGPCCEPLAMSISAQKLQQKQLLNEVVQ